MAWVFVAVAVIVAYWIGQYRGYRSGVRFLLGPAVRAGERLGAFELAKQRCRCGAFSEVKRHE